MLDKKRWSPEEDELLRKLVIQGYSAAEIATDLKRSFRAIKARAHVIGIPLGYYKAKPTTPSGPASNAMRFQMIEAQPAKKNPLKPDGS